MTSVDRRGRGLLCVQDQMYELYKQVMYPKYRNGAYMNHYLASPESHHRY